MAAPPFNQLTDDILFIILSPASSSERKRIDIAANRLIALEDIGKASA